jgi:cbb3-type cytochrome oxidase subunit 3
MKHIIFFLAGLAWLFTCQAQNEYYNAKNGCDLQCQLAKPSEKYFPIFLQQQINSVSFVKFTVDAKGHVDDIECSFGSPSYIVDYAKEAVKSTDGNWIPARVDGKPLDKTTFLLPIVYQFWTGKKNADDERRGVYDNFYNGVSNMLHFGDNLTSDKAHFGGPITPTLSCIILNPVYLKTVS